MSYSDFDSGPDYLAPMAQDDEIGARVREVRGSATQEAFGKRLGVSRGAVANWERGLGIKRENMQAIVDNSPVISSVCKKRKFYLRFRLHHAVRFAYILPSAPGSASRQMERRR